MMMDKQNLVDICGPLDGGTRLARTKDGMLCSQQEGKWQFFDFNREYAGYYPSCTFTALAYTGDLFYLAGLDDTGTPYVFSSLLGRVWESRNLTAKHPLHGEVRASGRVVQILYEEEQRQVFLLCDNGQLIVLPDCPKCVRIMKIRQGVIGGYLKDREIVASYADGTHERVSVETSAQYRASISYMRQQLAQGGILVDVRAAEVYTADPIPSSINVPLEDLDSWLRDQDKTQAIFFVCQIGVKSDLAVKYARRNGFSRAYSVGGLNTFAHVE